MKNKDVTKISQLVQCLVIFPLIAVVQVLVKQAGAEPLSH
jgi:hypothetical protein